MRKFESFITFAHQMRRIFAISLIALTMLNVFGFYVAFLVKSEGIKKEVAALITKGAGLNTQVLRFTKTEFEGLDWNVKGKEFRLNGHLHDVVKTETSTLWVLVYVMEDKDENDLVEGFVSLLQQRSDKDEGNSPIKILLDHFLKEFTLDNMVLIYNNSMADLPAAIARQRDYFSFFVSELQSPPPQAV